MPFWHSCDLQLLKLIEVDEVDEQVDEDEEQDDEDELHEDEDDEQLDELEDDERLGQDASDGMESTLSEVEDLQ